MATNKILQRFALFLAVGTALCLVQFDQAARTNTRFAAFLPAGMGGYADAVLASAGVLTDSPEVEVRLEALLRNRPIEARHLSLYSVWAAEADQMDKAGRALSLATSRGWRDPYVQIATLASAMSAGKVDVAAARLDALTRTQREPGVLFAAIDVMSDTQEGRDAVGSRVAESDFFADQLIDYANARPGKEGTALELLEKAGFGGEFACERRDQLAAIMLKRGLGDATRTIAPECEGSDMSTSVLDPYSQSGAFEWSFPNSSGVAVRSGRQKGTISYNNRNLVQKVLAQRYFVFEPGLHEISLFALDAANRKITSSDSSGIEVRITCPDSTGSVKVLLLVQRGLGEQAFSVPPDCPVQHVRLLAKRGREENLKLEIE